MATLMNSIQGNEKPLNSGEENLGTLQTVFASYRSAAEGRTVALSEIE